MVQKLKTDAERLADANDLIRTKQNQIKALEKELRSRTQVNDSAEKWRTEVFGLSAYTREPPTWVTPTKAATALHKTTGVPLIIASDWHHGEFVDPDQVAGMNSFNRKISKQRVKIFGDTILDLCFKHMTNPIYPGVVFCVAGDMITGAIHDDLRETNDGPVSLAVVEVEEMLIGMIKMLADNFGKVFVPCVPGNHARTTLKPRAKNKVFDSWEWVIYMHLEQWFRDDPRVTIHAPSEVDAHFAIYGHRFMLTHGDSLGVKGGDGIIGALGPIARGTLKVGSSEAKCGRDFDTLLMGHYHTYIGHNDAIPVIVNGSLIGYNEYARLLLRAAPTRPLQSLTFIHPKRGITASWPIYLDSSERKKPGSTAWLSWDTNKPKSV